MHITASVFINDNESGLHGDYERWLEDLNQLQPRTLVAMHLDDARLLRRATPTDVGVLR